jgi:hypothetical protein|tara:strand:+ start:159 stop:368 length:210 start_codon:yes stop_codon:yes gene_type:complete
MNTEVTDQILTSSLRETLKILMQKELNKLPEILESLDPKERLNALCKLMPYVFPKVETITSKEGEPLQW